MDVSDQKGRPDQRSFAAAVNESQELLRYAAQAGIELSPDIIRALVHAKHRLDSNEVSAEDAAKFYAACTTLAARVAPVTVATLRTSESKTRRSLRSNGVLSVALALVVVIFSGITFVTGSMSKDIESGITVANELAVKLRARVGLPSTGQFDETACGGATRRPNPSIPPGDESLAISDLQDFAATIRNTLRTATKLNLLVWNWEESPLDSKNPRSTWWMNADAKLQLEPGLINVRKELFCKIHTYQDVRGFAANVRADSVAVYGALSAYVLPVLYALLGAFAYNLRDFSERVRRRTYHPSSYANTARTVVAVTAGAIISLFNNFSQGTSLPPLALAFLVGYGVEAFFAFLDALLVAFSAKGRTESSPAPPPSPSSPALSTATP